MAYAAFLQSCTRYRCTASMFAEVLDGHEEPYRRHHHGDCARGSTGGIRPQGIAAVEPGDFGKDVSKAIVEYGGGRLRYRPCPSRGDPA